MSPELRLRFLKMLIDVPVRLVDRILPEVETIRYPQTAILLGVHSGLLEAYRLECVQGTFGSRPDGNFERLLRVFAKAISWISEDDRYYRAWLGLGFLLVKSELQGIDRTPITIKELIKRQWLMDLDFLPDSYMLQFEDEFVEVALCDYLGNLARRKSNGEKAL